MKVLEQESCDSEALLKVKKCFPHKAISLFYLYKQLKKEQSSDLNKSKIQPITSTK